MKVMILSGNTGGGHFSCAKTIKEEFALRGIPCEIYDALRFAPLPVAWIISNWHNIMYRFLPKINRKFYAYETGYLESRGISPLYELLFRIGARALAKKIKSENINTVICTHSFAAYMLTKAIKDHGTSVRSAYVATDYTREGIVKYTDLDYYFIPSELLADEFICENIPREKVIGSGIPVAKDFYAPRERKTDNGAGGKVLIAGGSAGCGPIKKLVFELAKTVPEDTQIAIVCGNNKSLYRSLKRNGKDPRIAAYGYVDNMAELMRDCDVFITKPGGISTTEAAASETPTILYDLVQGCESFNYDFFVRRGAACPSASIDEVVEKVSVLLESAGEREQLIANMSKIRIEDSAKKIVDCFIS